jgi:hypothetical protein
MEPITDIEFERLQTWYRPSRVKRMLEEYRALLYPHIPEREDERGMPHYRSSHDPPVCARVHGKADIDRALIWLQYVQRDLDGAETVHLYYLTLRRDGQVHTQEDVARILGCTERTVRNRLNRAIQDMSWYLGWYENWEAE